PLSVIVILLLSLVLSFFFSGMEIAFLSSSRLKIELKLRQNVRSAVILSKFTKRVSEVLITILIGNNLALVIFTIYMDRLTTPFLEGITSGVLAFTLLQSLITTLIILIFAEYIPKAIFRKLADTIVFPASYILSAFFWLLRWPVILVNAISRLILRYLFRVTTDDKIVGLGRKDLDQYIQEVIAASEKQEMEDLDLDTEMLNNALSFKETKARECMIPRTEIIAVTKEADIEELMDTFIEHALSKIIIYEDSLDRIAGFVHSSSMFSMPKTIEEVMQPVFIVPEAMQANNLLAEFSENKRSVAIVVDEFGGTSGMITMEDLIEEVFGEIEDEHDEEELPEEDLIKLINEDGSITLGARHEIDDLNEDEDLGIELPDEEYYTTLGGLIMYHHENIPKQGEEVEIEVDKTQYKFSILKATPSKIIAVKLSIHER
ncbi:MAG: hemolysin family protein, partial [Bacteroidota bacterium]